MGELLLGVGQAALQAFEFGFQDAREEVGSDLDEPRPFCRVNDEDGTTDTGVLMSTVGSVCAAAVAQGELAALEMSEELVPLL
ncbi:hypothetical protein GCM10010304_80900 [Streptomyces roseoviolaceus]